MGGLRRIEEISEMLKSIALDCNRKDRDLRTGDITIKEFDGPLNPADLSGKRA